MKELVVHIGMVFLGLSLQAQNPNTVDSLVRDFTKYDKNLIDSICSSSLKFFILEDNEVCPNLAKLERDFLTLRTASEVRIALYKEFLKDPYVSPALLYEADEMIPRHQEAIALVDEVLNIFYMKCIF